MGEMGTYVGQFSTSIMGVRIVGLEAVFLNTSSSIGYGIIYRNGLSTWRMRNVDYKQSMHQVKYMCGARCVSFSYCYHNIRMGVDEMLHRLPILCHVSHQSLIWCTVVCTF
jgi:hypothetical protein